MEKERSIVKQVRIVSLYDQPSDAEFWRAQPPEARLAALEQIRQEYQESQGVNPTGITKVGRIVKLGGVDS